ncbi:MAG: SLBB domain-containing protein [Candidatus Latescibacteria bacterium]|nr:SLBB domain-containing protein [Candidatus Latescibacterota bacterium]
MLIGEVNNGGIFEFKEGDTISDLVVFGGGLTAIADSANANLVRFSDKGDELINIPINIYDAVFNHPDDPRYKLKESDRLFIQTKYNYKVLANVTVDGQVKYPGSYAIIPHESTLTQIIGKAGGFTDYANLDEARIIRRTSSALRDLEYERLRRMLVADMTDDEYEFFKHRSRQQEGMISINFVKLFQENDMSYEMLLEDGDHIFIPLKRELINVLGAVQEPGYMKVDPGKGIDYYIQLAGGYNWNAKTRGIRIIKGKTGQRLKPGENIAIEGGDTIHIPEKKPVNYWESFLDGAQLFANLATLIIIARNISK